MPFPRNTFRIRSSGTHAPADNPETMPVAEQASSAQQAPSALHAPLSPLSADPATINKPRTANALPAQPGRISNVTRWIRKRALPVMLSTANTAFKICDMALLPTAAAGVITYEYQAATRAEEVTRVNDFLNGKCAPGAKMEIYGRIITGAELRQLVFNKYFTCNTPAGCKADDSKELKGMIDSFAKMIMVEDAFGTRLNTLPILESAGVTETFGYGQIAPGTALEILQRNRRFLAQYFPALEKILTEIDQKRKAGYKYGKNELAELLDLRGASNILPSLLYFNEINIAYADAHVIENNGIEETRSLVIDPRENQRNLSLTVAAYSARITSPVVAKVQSAINDIIEFYPGTAKKLGLPALPLTVDGDMGKDTEKSIMAVSNLINPQWGPYVVKEIKSGASRMPNIEKVSLFANEIGKRTVMDARVSDFARKHDGVGLMNAIESRYGATVALYELLRENVPQENAEKLHSLFMNYVNNRWPVFFTTMKDPQKFAEMFPALDYERFLGDAAAAYQKALKKDNKYFGVIPIFYRPAAVRDPKNPMERVVIAHRLFGNKIFDEPVKLGSF